MFSTIEDIYVALVETERGAKEKVHFYDTAGLVIVPFLFLSISFIVCLFRSNVTTKLQKHKCNMSVIMCICTSILLRHQWEPLTHSCACTVQTVTMQHLQRMLECSLIMFSLFLKISWEICDQ